MTDIPARLSEQQKFILAWLSRDDDNAAFISKLSWEVAKEFDDDDETDGRILDPDEERRTRDEVTDEALDRFDFGNAKIFSATILTLQDEYLPDEPVLEDTHNASLSRSLRRLEDRGLIERSKQVFSDGAQATRPAPNQHNLVYLTDDGCDVGGELNRRVTDGRYGLSFERMS